MFIGLKVAAFVYSDEIQCGDQFVVDTKRMSFPSSEYGVTDQTLRWEEGNGTQNVFEFSL